MDLIPQVYPDLFYRVAYYILVCGGKVSKTELRGAISMSDDEFLALKTSGYIQTHNYLTVSLNPIWEIKIRRENKKERQINIFYVLSDDNAPNTEICYN